MGNGKDSVNFGKQRKPAGAGGHFFKKACPLGGKHPGLTPASSSNKPVAGSSKHLEHLLKTIIIVIGIRHTQVFAGVQEIEDQFHFFPLRGEGRQTGHVVIIVHIHDQNVVETIEVGRLKLPGALVGNVDAVLPGNEDRAPVGEFSGVPVAGTGTVYRLVEPVHAGFVLHNAFGKGAAADIAEANHQNTHAGDKGLYVREKMTTLPGSPNGSGSVAKLDIYAVRADQKILLYLSMKAPVNWVAGAWRSPGSP